MPTSGDGTVDDGRDYTWEVAGFGELQGDWHKGEPADSTVREHIADSDWGMLIEFQIEGQAVDHFFIYGGYEPDDLGDVIDVYVEQYG